jgi:Na+-driven multidrug efflux pump
VLLILFARLFGEQGAAAAVLVAQTCAAIGMAMTLYMQRVPFFLRREAVEQ